jgi:putative ABC transport system permease protein
VTVLLAYETEPVTGFKLGATTLSDLGADEGHSVALTVAGTGIVLAVLNILVASWSAAVDAQRASAIARTLGATPGQVTAGLSVTQVLPAVPGAILGVAVGVGVIELLTVGDAKVVPPLPWLVTIALGTLATVAVLTAVPARAAARRSLAGVLSAEAT